MTAAVGDVAELGDVDVDQRPGMVMFVAADRLPGDPVDPGQPVGPAADQDRMDGGGRQAEPAADLDRAEPDQACGLLLGHLIAAKLRYEYLPCADL